MNSKMMLSMLGVVVFSVVGCAGGAETEGDGTVDSESNLNADNGEFRTRVTCESQGSRYNTCNIAPNDERVVRVRFARQLSRSSCNEGQSWGSESDYIWVNYGCRAEFDVILQSRPQTESVRCSSDHFAYKLCNTGLRNIRSIRLAHRESDSACVEGNSFGYSGSGVWVDRGCAGTFEVEGSRQ